MICRRSYQIDELRKMEAQTDSDYFAVVAHWSYESVVMTQQVVIQSFGIRISICNCC